MLGAIFGDICGSIYEFHPVESYHFPLLTDKSIFTDDTVLTLAIADAFINNKDIASTLRNYAREYTFRGYGQRFNDWVWDDTSEPYWSYGNGSAMRVSSVGFLFDSIEDVLENAKKSAEVTHNHYEGIKGAQATALAIFLARNHASKEEIKHEIESRFGYNLSKSLAEIEKNYRFTESCQGSVPEALIAFLESDDYESAIRNAIWLKGDADTQACIAGSIAEAFYGDIPDSFKAKIYELLPKELLLVVEQFYTYMDFKNAFLPEDFEKLEKNFHALIVKRITEEFSSIELSRIKLPHLKIPFIDIFSSRYVGIDGMYGGFQYTFDASEDVLKLIVESWSRIIGGSGQKHIVTPEGFLCVGMNTL